VLPGGLFLTPINFNISRILSIVMTLPRKDLILYSPDGSRRKSMSLKNVWIISLFLAVVVNSPLRFRSSMKLSMQIFDEVGEGLGPAEPPLAATPRGAQVVPAGDVPAGLRGASRHRYGEGLEVDLRNWVLPFRWSWRGDPWQAG
jgi:hypothetical protein